jgi:signal transduction histidine kinase
MVSMGWTIRKPGLRRAAAASPPAALSLQAPGQHWRTTTFRWLTTYAAIFSLAFMALIGLIEYSVTRTMERETDSGLRWQLRYFDARGDAELPAAIAARLAHDSPHQNHYGLFTPDGRYVAGDLEVLPASLSLDSVRQTHDRAAGTNVRLQVDGAQDTLRAMGEVRPNGQRLVVARTLADVRRVRGELVHALVFGGVLCLGASVLGGLLISVHQMRRVSAIRKATAAIAAGNLSSRLPNAGRDELAMLAQLVNRMLDEVERLMAEVKLATDGIAHDLRTPLVRLRARLSNASSEVTGRNAEDLATVVAAAREEVDGLLGRFTAMLRIAELGSRQRRAAFSELDLEPLVGDLCDLYEPLAEEKRVVLERHLAPVAPVFGDRALLFEAFSNLVDNAVKFTPEGGIVRVRLEAVAAGGSFSIADSGPGIPEDERTLVLDQLYRGRQTRHLPGSGLGLGIVSAIVGLHDFALDISGSSHGTVVRVDCWPHNL